MRPRMIRSCVAWLYGPTTSFLRMLSEFLGTTSHTLQQHMHVLLGKEILCETYGGSTREKTAMPSNEPSLGKRHSADKFLLINPGRVHYHEPAADLLRQFK